MDDELLDLLAHELGEVHHWEQECPGVYYVSILPAIGSGGDEGEGIPHAAKQRSPNERA